MRAISLRRGTKVPPDPTSLVQRRYDRIARVYDLFGVVPELLVRRWRRDLWARVPGGRMLEVGVGTGKNLRYYAARSDAVAMDLSDKMLARARRRADRLGSHVQFDLADVQRLPFADASFDAIVATFVFCSVPDPVRGLQEVRRVLRPGGRVLLLEHVLSQRPVLRRLMQWFDPVPVRVSGAHIARDTVANVQAAGLTLIQVEDLALDVVKRIEATVTA